MSVNRHQLWYNHQEGGDAGWEIVGYIVETGSKAAEVTIAVGLVANHGIEGVDHLVGQHARYTTNGKPKEWSNDPIAQVLSEGFQGCRTNLLGRELGGVAPHNASHLLASLFKGTVNRQEGLTHLTNEGGASKTPEDDEGTKGY